MVSVDRDSVPYAPTGNVLTVVTRSRERGVPNPLTIQELERIGIPTGNAPRTLVALRYLGLIDEDGGHTPEFDRLRRAQTDAYPEVFAEILRAAYHGVFAIVDPAKDGEIAIRDAFRGFSPEGQRERMITLFMGLCKAAGIVPTTTVDAPKQRAAKPVSAAAKVPKAKKKMASPKSHAEPDGDEDSGIDYRLLSVLMQRLPRNGKWTADERSKWLQAVTASVDLIVEVESV